MSTMNSAENLNFKVVAFGDERKPCNFKSLNLEKIVKWIKNKNLGHEIEQELIKKAGTYPNSSLLSFKSNFSKHLSKVKKIVRDRTPLYTKELGDDDESESNPHTALFNGAGISQEIPESPHEDSFG